MAKALLSGDAETVLVLVAPIVGGVITYFGRNLSFLFTDVRDDWRMQYTYWRARRTLAKMQQRQGLPATRKKEIGQDIDDLDRLFTSELKERVRARIGKGGKDQP